MSIDFVCESDFVMRKVTKDRDKDVALSKVCKQHKRKDRRKHNNAKKSVF